ncbi:MAG: N-acetyldiaminopimelate deacetylase [Streptococcus peroris]|uniref:N-acetyldiaminopimelate deacetylase n=1 Tax=Streptococcus peroris TaxID=68891 RepID=UPI002908F261|nr:N-acetyldiaminopimelate deacetylase [Streptococcus peroris]MDU7074331.1 N-acetyldiaminopimelate deacetylase [Streptococcus peroris]
MLDLIQTRRDLHQIPEIGLEEFETQAYLLDVIKKLIAGKDFVELRTWRTGILVYLHGSQPTKTIALGSLERALEKQPKNNLLFLFQPAEENEAGGMLMYKDQAFSDWLPDQFYGLHVRPDLKVGQIATNTHTLFAGTCEIKINFKGKGGHAAFPHEAKDAVVAASYFITQVQSVVSRSVNPIEGAVVTFGVLQAGTTNNVIAETAFLHGTIRSLTQEMSLLVQKRVTTIAEAVAAAFDMDVEIELKQGGYLPVENNPKLARELMDFFQEKEAVELIDIEPAMTGEDFGYLLSKVDGVMFWLGIDSPYALHHPKMRPKEEALAIGVEAVSSFLAKKAAE